jgi:hypothetical protein
LSFEDSRERYAFARSCGASRSKEFVMSTHNQPLKWRKLAVRTENLQRIATSAPLHSETLGADGFRELASGHARSPLSLAQMQDGAGRPAPTEMAPEKHDAANLSAPLATQARAPGDYCEDRLHPH